VIFVVGNGGSMDGVGHRGGMDSMSHWSGVDDVFYRGGVVSVFHWSGSDGMDSVFNRGSMVRMDWSSVNSGVMHRRLMVDGLVVADDVLRRHSWCVVQETRLAHGHKSARDYDLTKKIYVI
jgi:hypothetical protein